MAPRPTEHLTGSTEKPNPMKRGIFAKGVAQIHMQRPSAHLNLTLAIPASLHVIGQRRCRRSGTTGFGFCLYSALKSAHTKRLSV